MAIGIGLGLAEFPFSGTKAFWEWVALCEEGGVDSLWQTDRLVSSVPHLEVMSVMAALAGATRRIKFGMNVASAGLRDPLVLAKQCATIDVLSNGRLLPAFGVGSPLAPDWAATGRDPKVGARVAEEAIEIIGRLWREPGVTFEGRHFRYRDATIAPRPVQAELPLWIGGSSRAAIRRTARLGTGWQAGSESPEEIRPIIAAIKAQAEAFGRRIADDHYGTGFFYRFGKPEEADLPKRMAAFAKRTGRDPRHAFAVGGAGDILRHVEDYIAAGISKFILRPVGTGDADLMEQTRLLIREVLPEVERLNGRR